MKHDGRFQGAAHGLERHGTYQHQETLEALRRWLSGLYQKMPRWMYLKERYKLILDQWMSPIYTHATAGSNATANFQRSQDPKKSLCSTQFDQIWNITQSRGVDGLRRASVDTSANCDWCDWRSLKCGYRDCCLSSRVAERQPGVCQVP